MEDRYKIDDVAKESGLTKRTIRYYEEIGLLPSPERTDGGTRLYTRMHIERLKQIINARDVLGFSLQEIIDFVAIREQLMQHRDAYRQTEEAEQKRKQLVEVGHTIDKQMQMIDHKLEKMKEFREELVKIKKRVTDALDQTTT
ncbi:MerR family transcriptional regulator [Paenibacillus sp. CF384]|uniref:MerR family transcriptional regulator n=1 Tax=Paenibacillus sp. CF384 TaxID=1884382 RepID=UPI000896A20D|nr:MerR family transcriptional regulator [Paenibacillus sp. CF384]SDW95767.1 DNA-binding transcriptional regulator, MerR family [Paenibacillus sp. CF384]